VLTMRTIKTNGLPDSSHAERVYTFLFDERSRPVILHIPGETRGPDVCIPYSAEQEEWLNSLAHLITHTWDCQWTFINESSVNDFLALLKPMLVEAEG
jgi:hypothetical protein